MITEIDVSQYDQEIQITGLYVQSTVESMAGVSSVFERKMKSILADQGIENVDPDGWHNAAAFFATVQKMADEIGDKTIFEAGRSMGQDVPVPDDADSPHDIVSRMDELHYESYKNVDARSERSIGGYTYERIDETTARLGVTEGFPFHSGIAQGSPEGIVSSMTGGTVRGEEVETTPTGPRKSAERRAYRLSW